jgi:TetR/AcrR family transcriptional repressor of nem operon
MSGVDEGFRLRINQMIEGWQDGFAKALKRGQALGEVNKDVDIECTAIFLIASIQGALGLAKNAQDVKVLEQCVMGMIDYLECLQLKA